MGASDSTETNSTLLRAIHENPTAPQPEISAVNVTPVDRTGGSSINVRDSHSHQGRAGPCMNRSRAWGASLLVIGGCLPCLLGRDVVQYVAAQHHLATSANPYFQPSHAFMFYLLMPVVVLSSFVLFLAPAGLMLIALGRSVGWCTFLGKTFVASLAFSIAATIAGQQIFGTPLTGKVWLGIYSVATALSAALVVWRSATGRGTWPIRGASDRRRVGWTVLMPLVAICLLFPKLMWENFNGDGYEAFEFGRSLAEHPLPHWRLNAELNGFFPNFCLFAYVNNWFTLVFGPIEAAARLPFVMYLVVLFCGVVGLAEQGTRRKLAAGEELVVWLGLATFAVVTCFNISYDPFFVDIAEPTATDTLLMVCFLVALQALWRGAMGWWVIAASFAYLSSPAGLLLILLLCVASVVLARGHRIRAAWPFVLALTPIVVIAFLYEAVYLPRVLGVSSIELSIGGLLRKMQHLRFSEYERLAFLLVPAGLVPALAMFWFTRQDRWTRALSGAGLVYFGIMYIRAFGAPHQFIPVFVIPLVVFWRMMADASDRFRKPIVAAVTLATVLSLWLSLPRHFDIDGSVRALGMASAFRVGGNSPADPETLARAGILHDVIQPTYMLADPAVEWGTSPYPWLYYTIGGPRNENHVNYLVIREDDRPPVGWLQASTFADVALYVRDRERWNADRRLRLTVPYRSALYQVPNRMRFAHLADEQYAIDVKDLLPASLVGRVKDRFSFD